MKKLLSIFILLYICFSFNVFAYYNKSLLVNTNNIIIDDTNNNLKTLHLDQEGLSPYFDKNVTDYYFVTDKEITSLKIEAIPESDYAKVNITGNNNFKQGLNQIKIEVISPNGKNTKIYTINVTKTNDMDLSNSNLDSLIIENSLLYPNFDTNITNYSVEIENTISFLNILAVPENPYSLVTIEGKDNLKIGDNLITITIKAQDKTTEKKYYITAHRRTTEEELIQEQENKKQKEKLNELIKSENINLENNQIIAETVSVKKTISSPNKFIILIILVFVFSPIILITIKRFRKKYKS